MKFKDEGAAVKWCEDVARNSDPYGSAVMAYARRWAEAMESHIDRCGGSVADCAQETSHSADIEGITGFMYGCAVERLSWWWIHGEELRRWHNLKTQLSREGEEANASGGVLNPAVFTVKGGAA